MSVNPLSSTNSHNGQVRSDASPLKQAINVTLLSGLVSAAVIAGDRYYPDATRKVINIVNFDFSDPIKTGVPILEKIALKTQIKAAAIIALGTGAIFGLYKHFSNHKG